MTPQLLLFSTSSAVCLNPVSTPRTFLATTGPVYPIDPSWPSAIPSLQDEVFANLNVTRKQNGRDGLFRDPLLDLIAQWKADQMAAELYMDHTDHAPPVERPFGDRFYDYGYTGAAFGENIAYGFTSVRSTDPNTPGVMDAWMSDYGHKENCLNPSWLGVGIGVAKATNGLIFWVQDFGSRPQVGTTGPTGSSGPSGPSGPTGVTGPAKEADPNLNEKWKQVNTGKVATITAESYIDPVTKLLTVGYKLPSGKKGTMGLLKFKRLYDKVV